MLRLTRTVLALGLVATLGACSEDLLNPGDLLPVDPALVGTWQTTAAVVSDPNSQYADVDLIAQGAAMSIDFALTGSYTMTFTMPGETEQVETGTFQFVEADVIELMETGASVSQTWTLGLTSSAMTVDYDDTFDFDEDGNEEPAHWNFQLQK